MVSTWNTKNNLHYEITKLPLLTKRPKYPSNTKTQENTPKDKKSHTSIYKHIKNKISEKSVVTKMEKNLRCYMWYESTAQIEREILSDIVKTINVVWNKVLDVEEPTQEINNLKRGILC